MGEIQVNLARAEPHFGSIHHLTRIRPPGRGAQMRAPSWSFSPGRRYWAAQWRHAEPDQVAIEAFWSRMQ
jgi:hypothetical protein